jgi:tetratricopeptide (TPR) repeat protein
LVIRTEAPIAARDAAVIRYHRFTVCAGRAEYASMLALAREVREIGEHSGDPGLERAALYCRGNALFYLGRLSESLECLAAARVHRDDGPPQRLGHLEYPGILAWAWLCWGLCMTGFAERSCDAAATGLEHARALGHPYSVCYLTGWGAVEAMYRRDWPETRRLGSEAARLGVDHGYSMLAAVGVFAEASAAAHAGDMGSVDRFTRAMGEAASLGNRAAVSCILGIFADLLLTVGRIEEALQQVEGALALARAADENFYLAELHRLKGEILLGLGGPGADQAEALFREAIENARRQEARLFEIRAATSLVRLWQRQGKRTEAGALLAPIYGWFTEGFDTRELIEAQALLDELG